MTTITSSTTIGITLSSPTYTNPIVVNPGVTISTSSGNAIYAASGYWAIQNGGTISSTGTYGIDLLAGGSVTNAASATISGYNDGIDIKGAAGTVVNSGDIAGATLDGVYLFNGGLVSNAAVITGSAYGVALGSGGSVTNAASATISGGIDGVYVAGASGTVVNSGSIATNSNYGVKLLAGGTITNAASATIYGYKYGVGAIGGASVTNAVAGTIVGGTGIGLDSGTVINSGIITGAAYYGIELLSGGVITNVASASISGLVDGIFLDAGGTVTNAGTIAGGSGTAIVFGGTGSSQLVVEAGAVFSGTVVVSGGGQLDVVSAFTGAVEIDDASTLEFTSPYVGVATFSDASTGSAGTLKLDAPSTGPITVVNTNDTVIAQPGGNNWINAAVSYTLPANIDALFLYAGAQGTGNSDAAGDALYALDAGNAQTLTGNSPNDTFVVYNSSDVVVPKAGSRDVVYAAASYTLPTGVDALILEGSATQGVGNGDAAGDGLYAANPGQVATLTGNSPNDTFVVYNSADVVVPKVGSHDVVYSAVNYTLPTGVDILILEGTASQGIGNSDAAGDALYAANAGQVATLTGNSANDTFVVYNSADVVVPKTGSHDIVYAAVNYALPTGVDSLFLEGAATQAVGNSDVAGDTLYAANAGIAQTLTGNSHNDTFVVYNAGDTVSGQATSTDTVYAAANFTLPTNVDTMFLEGNASHGTGNSDAGNALYGNAGVASTLVAGSGADTLYVTGIAGTVMTGGAGHDTFAFPNVMGKDEVTNFGLAKDTLQFNMTLFSNFTAAMNAASQAGANTVFTIDANDTVTLDNVTKTSLTASNFHFS
jgi:Ca2+-binding RTX toxin-like protein